MHRDEQVGLGLGGQGRPFLKGNVAVIAACHNYRCSEVFELALDLARKDKVEHRFGVLLG